MQHGDTLAPMVTCAPIGVGVMRSVLLLLAGASAGPAWAQALIVDDEVVEMDGVYRYDEVRVINGGVLRVTPLSESGGGGLEVTADRIYVDANSRIEAVGSGYPARQAEAGQGPFGGPFPGGGGGHAGAGGPARGADCGLGAPASGYDPVLADMGSGGGSTSSAPGGAGVGFWSSRPATSRFMALSMQAVNLVETQVGVQAVRSS